jgi:hypothetical protein
VDVNREMFDKRKYHRMAAIRISLAGESRLLTEPFRADPRGCILAVIRIWRLAGPTVPKERFAAAPVSQKVV